jgi:hypothetical protein
VKSIAKGLSGNTRLLKLNLSRCDVGDVGVACLALALKSNRTLQTLDLKRLFHYVVVVVVVV